MKVSVVVPVFDGAGQIGPLLESLRAQTLPAHEVEVVLVDDGSTDGTPALLDAFAAGRPGTTVLHLPHTGWPGRPRNAGLDAARGEYVFLADHDDHLAPDALERLTAFADEHGSDVVVGRVVGVGRRAPKRIFERTLVDAQDDPDLLMTSLTPQKLYRRAFLDETRIRFPEGRRRLEDHLFVTTAIVRARRVSVYADSPVYYFLLRADRGNLSRRPIEWRAYYGYAAESVAVVDREAPDERTRVAMRRRWLRTEALSRVRGAKFLNGRPGRAELVAAARDFVSQHYPQVEIDALDAGDRIAARLLLEHDEAALEAFARWERSLAVRSVVESARIGPESLEVRVRVGRAAAAPRPPVPDVDLEALERLPDGAAIRLRAHGPRGSTVTGDAAGAWRDGVLAAPLLLPLAVLGPGRWVLDATPSGATGRSEALRIPADATLDPGARRARGLRRGLEVRDGRLHLVVRSTTPLGLVRRLTAALRWRTRSLLRARRDA